MKIEITNRQCFENLSFDEYLKLPFKSNSFLKSQVGGFAPDFTPTQKVLKGKALDAILTGEPLENYAHVPELTKLVYVMRTNYPWLKLCKSQMSYTCTMNFAGLSIPFKGRLDFELSDRVIDLKYTEEKKSNFRNLINHMKYQNQIWAYAKAANKQKGYILMINNKADHELIEIPITENNYFYEEQVINFGEYESK